MTPNNKYSCFDLKFGPYSCNEPVDVCSNFGVDQILTRDQKWNQHEQWQNFVRKSIGAWRVKFYDKHYKTMDPNLLTKRSESYYSRGYRRVNKLFFSKLYPCC